jgi:hypothetical protein
VKSLTPTPSREPLKPSTGATVRDRSERCPQSIGITVRFRRDALSRAKTAGKLADGVEPSSAARILVCFVEGLRVVGKTAPTRITSQATVDALLDRFTR